MKYSTQIVIRLPRQKGVELFVQRDNQYLWQPGLKSITLLEGSPGEEGARSELAKGGRIKVCVFESVRPLCFMHFHQR